MSARAAVERGPWLLRAPRPDLATHRATRGQLVRPDLDQMLVLLESARVRGRGGAGFPFATKLRATASTRGRPVVVVNLSEGEPASRKDAALAVTQPHLVLDGAEACAWALASRRVHVVVPEECDDVRAAVRTAVEERSSRRPHVRWQVHLAAPGFVSGEASAVTELVAGRQGLPVTSWEPTAVSGVKGRPTLLSNAETYAHVGALLLHGVDEHARFGTTEDPGTTLLTIGSFGGARVVREVEHGTSWEQVLGRAACDRPVLLGGYHGTWAPPGALVPLSVSRAPLREQGLALGAGVVLTLPDGVCPLEETTRVVRYLAGSSAGRCGPCLNGLPALASAVEELFSGGARDGVVRVAGLVGLVDGRGACAHPTGTARLVRSALTSFPEEVHAHLDGDCRRARGTAGVS